jgi:hypothetical protein
MRAVDRAIAELGVSLDGLVVYTEAASGPYAWTPLLAARAGAARVYALARDNAFHRARDVAAATRALAERHGLEVRVVLEKRAAELAEADIVTNSASLRPITAADVAALKPTAALPLMWETWEFVPGDLDLAACRARGVVVLGTHEHRPPCDLRPYERVLAVRMLFELGLEGAKSAVTVLGGQVLAEEIEGFLRAAGCTVERHAAPWAGVRVTGDALLVAEAADRRLLIGPGGVLEVGDVPPETRVGVIAGDVDAAALRAAGRTVFPERVRGGGRMSFDISALGPRPVLELYAAGLRVGAVTARARLAGATPEEAAAAALADGVAMDF